LLERIGEIDRAACRAHVAENFSSDALRRAYAPLLVAVPASTAPAPMVFSAPHPTPSSWAPHPAASTDAPAWTRTPAHSPDHSSAHRRTPSRSRTPSRREATR